MSVEVSELQPPDQMLPLEQLPRGLRAFMDCERFNLLRLDQFHDCNRDPSFDVRYFPENSGAFRLPCYWIAKRHLQVYGCPVADSQLPAFRAPPFDDGILFPIHPTSIPYYGEFLARVHAVDSAIEGPCIWAVPTSSTRTLLAWPDAQPEKAIFFKTSLHSQILGARRLDQRTIARSVGQSMLVSSQRSELLEPIRYFVEPLGIIPRLTMDGGTLIRYVPPELMNDELVLAPLFALIGGCGAHPPILLAMREQNGLDILGFVTEFLCDHFARLWLRSTLQRGIILESHGQDLLMQMSARLVPQDVLFYRDFEGLHIDFHLRRTLDLATPSSMPCDWMWRDTYATRGFQYNSFIWAKMENSLLQYMDSFLVDVENTLRQWQRKGLLGGRHIRAGDITMEFSRRMLRELRTCYDAPCVPEYNILQNMRGFLLHLSGVRRLIMSAGSAYKGN